ncbi:MAG: class I SAM-dependent methyltransferase [Betaproteobacteria bacterium]|nr:class I SAM-dependent methyltransferase [Betaproteobacteria bacterium]
MNLNSNVRNVTHFGQVFTPAPVITAMLALARRLGDDPRRVLEPSCGDGAFLRHLPPQTVGIEIDARHCPEGAQCLDFFLYPATEFFTTIIGNPPYVGYRQISAEARQHLKTAVPGLLDGRANLYLFFIEKCLRHLSPCGELVFVTPRDFLKNTSSTRLNRWLWEQGTITDLIDLGDARVFEEATPNCVIWRFERDDFSRRTRYADLGAERRDLAAALAAPNWERRRFIETDGHLLFVRGDYSLRLSDVAAVKVGAVSGADSIYHSELHGTRDFVCSHTARSGQTRRMIWCAPEKMENAPSAVSRLLEPHKERLLARRVRNFDESNWWQWGRGYQESCRPRVYVNNKTRRAAPFFVHPCPHYDGSVMAIFPHAPTVDVDALAAALNRVDWADLGFVCDGRFLFSQRSLECSPLPAEFGRFLPSALALRGSP